MKNIKIKYSRAVKYLNSLIDKIPLKQKHEKLYTEASRARHKLYVLN